MRARRLASFSLAATIALLTACGAKVAVDESSSPTTTSIGGAGGAGGTGGAPPVCEDVLALCDAYCKAFDALGCGDTTCKDNCLGALVLGSPPECHSAMVAAIACTANKGPEVCGPNFSKACSEEEAALLACWDLSGPCNGFECGACGCSNAGCKPKFETKCHGVEDGVECDCLRDGQLLGSCFEGGSCPSQLPGCCAEVFFPPCGL